MPSKFRVWNRKEWRYENFFLSHDGVLWEREPNRRLFLRINYKVSFSTGLLDRHGKEIWEIDIVRYVINAPWNEQEAVSVKGVIEWQAPQWWINGPDGGPADYHSLEVIGNLYENPDLLN